VRPLLPRGRALPAPRPHCPKARTAAAVKQSPVRAANTPRAQRPTSRRCLIRRRRPRYPATAFTSPTEHAGEPLLAGRAARRMASSDRPMSAGVREHVRRVGEQRQRVGDDTDALAFAAGAAGASAALRRPRVLGSRAVVTAGVRPALWGHAPASRSRRPVGHRRHVTLPPGINTGRARRAADSSLNWSTHAPWRRGPGVSAGDPAHSPALRALLILGPRALRTRRRTYCPSRQSVFRQ
jgi:hypothetical protein